MTTSVAPNPTTFTAAQADTLDRFTDPRARASLARAYAAHNSLQAECADVPLPRDAVSADQWEQDDCPQPWRTFKGSQWMITDHTEYPMENWSVR